MLSNAYLLAKFRFDTAENEPAQNLQITSLKKLILLTLLIRGAGIRVWVLTGDKLETAVDIAFSAGLFSEELAISTVAGRSGWKERIGSMNNQ